MKNEVKGGSFGAFREGQQIEFFPLYKSKNQPVSPVNEYTMCHFLNEDIELHNDLIPLFLSKLDAESYTYSQNPDGSYDFSTIDTFILTM